MARYTAAAAVPTAATTFPSSPHQTNASVS